MAQGPCLALHTAVVMAIPCVQNACRIALGASISTVMCARASWSGHCSTVMTQDGCIQSFDLGSTLQTLLVVPAFRE